MKTINDNYTKFRGKCKQMAEEAIKADPTLTLVRGHYYDAEWGMQQHWWTVRKDGAVYDPTALQFPSAGHGEYIPFDGMVGKYFQKQKCSLKATMLSALLAVT